MISPDHLADSYRRNVLIIKSQTSGMSHEDSLVQLPFRANCMNWVVGHIVTNRINVLKLLGVENPDQAELLARYVRESEPITDSQPGVLLLDELVEILDRYQAEIAGLLGVITAKELDRQVAFFGNRSMSVGEWLLFFFFHDTYHTGQTEILRQAAGMNDRII